jgi:CubicO group peptidase (beta-lactamase class C family)
MGNMVLRRARFSALTILAFVFAVCSSVLPSHAQWVARGWAGPEPITQSSDVHATNGVPRAEYAQIDSIMRQFMNRANVPNAQVAVAYQGKLLFSRAYQNTFDAATNTTGRQRQLGLGTSVGSCTPPFCFDEPAFVPTYVDTRFRVASLSKFLTGIAIWQLVLDGKLDANLSDPAYAILRSDPNSTAYNAAPADARMLNVTVKQLMQHEWGMDRDCIIYPLPGTCEPPGQPSYIDNFGDTTSGYAIPWPYTFPVAANTAWRRTCAEVLEIDLPFRLLHYVPGSPPPVNGGYYQYYNNTGYCWLARIIEIKSGLSFEQYVRQKVMQPLGVDWPRIGALDSRDRIDYNGTTADEVNFYYDQPQSVDATATLANFGWGGGSTACGVYPNTALGVPANGCQVVQSVGRLVGGTSGAGAWVVSAQEYMRIILSAKERFRAPHLLDFPGDNVTGSDSILTDATLGASSTFTYTPALTYGYTGGVYSAFTNTAPIGWGIDHAGSFPGTRAVYISNRRGWTFVITMNTNPDWSLGGTQRICATTTTERQKAWCELRGNSTLPASNTGSPVAPTTATSLAAQLNAMYADTTMRTRMENAQDLWANQIALPCRTDVDASGARRASSDGVMLLRAMLGMRGAGITANSGLSTANQTHDRTDRTARDFVTTKMLDIDGDGVVSADRDGVILLRAMLGFTGANVTAGVNQSGATRTTWDTGATGQQIKTYLNTSCAASL